MEQNQLMESRRKMFEKMGVKQAGQVMTESGAGGQNLSMLQKIQQIKSGGAKSELNKYITATAKPGSSAIPGAVDFSPIPEVKQGRKNPNAPQQQVDPKHKVALDNFAAPMSHVDNSELSAIDAMFGGGSSSMGLNHYSNSFDSGQSFMNQRPQNMDLDLDSTLSNMPSFNPQHALHRAQMKASNNNNVSQSNSFLKFAQNNPMGSPEDYAPENDYSNPQMQNMGITPAMKMMMESIAKTMAEQTLKKVLTEFTDNQKNKTFFEVYNKEKSVIRTSDGKFYKLTPVQIRRS